MAEFQPKEEAIELFIADRFQPDSLSATHLRLVQWSRQDFPGAFARLALSRRSIVGHRQIDDMYPMGYNAYYADPDDRGLS